MILLNVDDVTVGAKQVHLEKLKWHMDNIEFDNRRFPARILKFEFGNRIVSIETLQEIIIEDGKYKNEESKVTDEQIFFYVKDNKINMNASLLISEIVNSI